MSLQPEQFASSSLRRSPRGDDICQILAGAINSADAGQAVEEAVAVQDNQLMVAARPYDLAEYERIFIIGAGKAASPMLAALHTILKDKITRAYAITKQGYLDPAYPLDDPKITIVEASHPVPGRYNLKASARLASLVSGLTRRDLVICLFSGGGSALLVKPAGGLTLKSLQQTTQLLLSCGADVGEINTVRKHLDDLKGGGLARLLYPATVISLIISDVVGDQMDRIASGPTVADPTTYQDASAVLEKYQLMSKIPLIIRDYLQAGVQGKHPETVKDDDPALDRVTNTIIANNAQAVFSAAHTAKELGFHTQVLTTSLQGEAAQVGRSLAETIKLQVSSMPRASLPACFIAGGETTVTLRGKGLGGRNQELALGAVDALDGIEPLILVSLATDGGDGPTDAAGAVATHQTKAFGFSLGLYPPDFLANNDAYHYFQPLGDLLKTGPTMTNVNDLVLIFAL